MSLPLTGIIKLSDVLAEFGGSNPPRLKNYYLNGPNVHQNPQGTIPVSGQITLKNFYGGVGGVPAPVSTEFAPTVGNFSLVGSGANIDQVSLYFAKGFLYGNNVTLATWPTKNYGRLTILETTTFYPGTGSWSTDDHSLLFTGGSTGNNQPNPALPFTSAWINLTTGAMIQVNAQIASGNEYPPATPSSWVKFRIEFASAPGDEYITHSQDFTIDIYN